MDNMDNNKKKWSATITLSLVNMYELQPVLYKTDSSGYHNTLLRHKALDAIKEQLETMYKLEFSIDEISKKINNIRSQYLEVNRRAKKVLPSGSGAPSSAKPSWWLYEHLSFLLPFIKKDKGISNMNLSGSYSTPRNIFEEEELSENPSTEPAPLELNIVCDEDLTSGGELLSPVSEIARPASVASRESTADPLQVTRKKRKRNEPVSVDSTMIEAIHKISGESPPDDIKCFVNYIETELREIKNKAHFKNLKRELLSVIMKYQDEDM